MENIIPIDDLPDFIDKAIAKVNEGVALARRRGILAELPKEVQFDVVLVSNWQAQNFEFISTETSDDNGTSETSSIGSSGRTGMESSVRDTVSHDETVSAGQNGSYSYE